MSKPNEISYRRRKRRGLTLVEILVALLLFDMALLSAVAMSASAARQIGNAGRRTRAAVAASRRVEWLASHACSSSAPGSAILEHGVTESWSSTRIPGGLEIADSIRIASRVTEHIVLRTRIAC